jgi:signal transduction histidine kinase
MPDRAPIGHLVSADYAPRIRAERLIATSRVVLAAFSLLAVWLDPYNPTTHGQWLYALLLAYELFALVVATLVWLAPGPLFRLGIVTHAVDLMLFTMLTYASEGPTSPFFTDFLFAIVSATLRWQWRGTLWTAGAALVLFNGTGIYAVEVVGDPAFEESRFIIRSVYLGVMAGLLVYLGAYEARRRREMSALADWPRIPPDEPDIPSPRLLEGTARILGVPRVVLAWEETDEPWLRLASWSARGGFENSREPPETFDPLVPESLVAVPFLSRDVGEPAPVVLGRLTSVPRSWRGLPVHPAFQQRFGMRAVLCLPLRGDCFEGHLFAMERVRMTADDLVLGEVVAREVSSAMDHALLSRSLRRSAATAERMRLSRDLHDGVLQSLTGAALQLETLQRLYETEPESARSRLARIQRLIADEQRDLRVFIHDSQKADYAGTVKMGKLEPSLRQLIQRLGDIWGLRVELVMDAMEATSPDALVYDICLIVQEALVNAARHAAASAVLVSIAANNGDVHITVTDNGHGFPFHGEFDHATLATFQLGPVMLKERVDSLGGTLSIFSSTVGSRLDIRVPRERRHA